MQTPARLRWIGIAVSLALESSASAQGVPGVETRGARSAPAQIEDFDAAVPIEFEGLVLGADGAPAEGALVVTSAGGRALTDSKGSYRFEVRVPLEAESVQVTAVGRAGGQLTASTSVALAAASGTAWVGSLQLTSSQACQPSWLPTFGEAPGTNGSVHAMTGFDDGSGPALYAGGDFTSAGGVAASRIARWDGSRWSALAGGVDSDVLALTVFDDGGGPALYAGGSFATAGGATANRIAKWDGSGWAPLGSGLGGSVATMAVFDDGSGPALFVGGSFTTAGGVSANRIAKWNGSSWTPLGSGTSSIVRSLAVFDDGSGAALYAGGSFGTAGGVTVNFIAKWDGATWTALGSGGTSSVYCLTVFDDGSGPALVAGEDGGEIARWDGASWTTPYGGLNIRVDALAVFDDGSGPALYAGGQFNASTAPTFVSLGHIARWSGSSWTGLGSGVNGNNPFQSPEVFALTAFDDGSGPALYAGGFFETAGGVVATGIAQWDGSGWEGLGHGFDKLVYSLTTFDDGTGPALVAGGDFTSVSGVATNRIAQWNGSSWSSLGSGMDQSVNALKVYDDGIGPALYAGGSFTTAGGATVNRIAKWNGSSWTALGTGMNQNVSALTVYDDGGGPALYAGGSFTTAGGATASRIAKWNGSTWSALSSATFIGANPYIGALTVFDDGGGPALYAGGRFFSTGGPTLNNIAKWNGSSWTPLGSGTSGNFSDVSDLAVFDDGSGPALYAGGFFTTAGGVTVDRIAKWNGSSWSGVGGGMDDYVQALTVHDDGSGSALYAAGRFTVAGGVAANLIARWNGASWSALGSGLNDFVVHALTVFDDGSGPALFAGGDYRSALDSGDSYLAEWGCDTTPPTISSRPTLRVPDRLGTPPGEVVNFSVTATDVHDRSPSISCVPPSGSFFPAGRTLVTCTATDAAGNQSTSQFLVIVAPRVR